MFTQAASEIKKTLISSMLIQPYDEAHKKG
jgi:hypothetical protein